jgi:hypothetical protein
MISCVIRYKVFTEIKELLFFWLHRCDFMAKMNHKIDAPVLVSFLFCFQDFILETHIDDGCTILSLTFPCSIASTTDATEDKAKMESNKVVAVDALSDGETEVELVITKPRGKNWPHMKFLCTDHKEILFKILRAIDDCNCTKELSANNGDYPKSNRWNRLYDNCYGGGSEGRGLLAGHPLLTMASASNLKQKIMDIWAYLKKESTKDFIIVDMNLVQTDI